MEDKYYSPKIEEFYVGFEYELLEKIPMKDKYWGMKLIKSVFTEKIWKSIGANVDFFTDLDNSKVRVKYLDSSDIESLGFKLKVENKYGITFANRLYSIVYSKMKSNHLEIFLIQPYVNEYDGLKFSGVIKNKSELKKLLIQLEIINE